MASEFIRLKIITAPIKMCYMLFPVLWGKETKKGDNNKYS